MLENPESLPIVVWITFAKPIARMSSDKIERFLYQFICTGRSLKVVVISTCMNSLSAGKCCILLRFPRSLSPIVNDLWQVLTGKIKVLQLLFGKHPNFSKRIKIYPGAGCVAVGKRFGILKYLLNN